MSCHSYIGGANAPPDRPCLIGVYVLYRPYLIGVYVLYRPCLIGVYVLYSCNVHEWEGGRCEFHPLRVCTLKKCDYSEGIKCMETVQHKGCVGGNKV